MSKAAGATLEKQILAWVETLPAGVVRLTVEQVEMERVMRMEPTRVGAASIELRIADYGGCGVYAGEGFMIEELRGAPEMAIQICGGVRDGLLQERIWRWRDKTVLVDSVLKLPSGQLRSSIARRWWLLVLLPRKQEVLYPPWV